ncbi:Putative serine protease HtrA [Streptomyces hundungensis]|uniref:Serine protease HtrA n=1 Tax=Streptomyces hundungensis TaxID=1077946 RepID=A0A387HB45_9ACTN|nr:trypsin-like peptidase domain-containing protein [Streptomyces hundungensis]AYG80629.1 Putative serine protease HtrA [Streptomyces hundungensis]
MNEQTPTGPKPKWWSRPQTARPHPAEPAPETYDLAPPTAPERETGEHPVDPAKPAPADLAVELGPAPNPTQPPVELASAPDPAPASTDPAVELGPTPTPADPAVELGPAPNPIQPPVEPGPAPDPDPSQDLPGEPLRESAPLKPRHAPDPYGTPPYGGPGPWAPAPPVQRPVPTPPAGTALPQQAPYAAPGVPRAPYAEPQNAAPLAPHTAPVAPPAPVTQWLRYDPWTAPGTPGAPGALAAGEPFTREGRAGDRKGRRGTLLVGGVLLALVAGGIGGGVGAYVERTGGITSVKLPQSGKEAQGRAPDSVAGIAASALPSVVTIHVTGSGESGTGTGFVLDNAGHLLTNNHVVKSAGNAGKISVTFSGGESVPAEVVGRDAGYDLAVVKVTGVSGMKPLPLGNSDNVLVGDPVVAIGAPFDLSNTVTSGIISAKERPITAGGESGDGTDVSYVDALQTDAPINPGNSGGPLVDSKARVIGINSAIRSAGNGGSESGGGQAGSIGLGFAIPINQAKRVAEELINTGKATHPVIGVTLDMKFTGDGARVAEQATDGKGSVVADGPGAKAGIHPQDVITKVDGQRVHGGEELIVKIRAHRPGDRLRLTLQRDGKEQELTLTLGSSS